MVTPCYLIVYIYIYIYILLIVLKSIDSFAPSKYFYQRKLEARNEFLWKLHSNITCFRRKSRTIFILFYIGPSNIQILFSFFFFGMLFILKRWDHTSGPSSNAINSLSFWKLISILTQPYFFFLDFLTAPFISGNWNGLPIYKMTLLIWPLDPGT